MVKTVMVTGAASGIGAALSSMLAEAGHKLILSDLSESSLNTLNDSLLSRGFSSSFFVLDVTDQTQIDALAKQHLNVDVLINNAGAQYVANLEAFPEKKWRQLIDILLVGPAMLTRAFLPGMKERNFGRIINIGSIHSLVASPYKSAYVAAKHGLLGFSKTIALETAAFNITVNTICPSYVKTPLVEKQIAQQAAEHGLSEDDVINKIMLEPMPKKQFISLKEIFGAVVYLMSDSAINMTGQMMVIDGGWTVK